MMTKNAISVWLKPLACLALVFVLMLSPSGATHAASGMHGGHHIIQGNADIDANDYDRGVNAAGHVHDAHMSVSGQSGDGQKSEQCCNDVCTTAVLNEVGYDLDIQIAGSRYLTRLAQAGSIEPSGLLRPPQF